MLKILLSFIILFSLDVSARGGHYKNHRKVVKLKVDKKKCTSPCEVKLSAKLNRHNNKNIKEFLFNFGDGNKVTSTESSVLHTYRHTYKELPKFEWRSGNYWREFFRYLKYRLVKRRTEFKWMRPTLEVVYNKGHNSRKSSQRIRVKGELLTDVKPPVLASIQNFEVNEDETLSFTLKSAEGGTSVIESNALVYGNVKIGGKSLVSSKAKVFGSKTYNNVFFRGEQIISD